MHHRDGLFTGHQNLELYYQVWAPEVPPRGILAVVHGLGAHSDKCQNLIAYLVPRGYLVYGFDLRGHGRSPGQRAYINDWQEFREDLHCFLQLIKQQQPTLPLVFVGP